MAEAPGFNILHLKCWAPARSRARNAKQLVEYPSFCHPATRSLSPSRFFFFFFPRSPQRNDSLPVSAWIGFKTR